MSANRITPTRLVLAPGMVMTAAALLWGAGPQAYVAAGPKWSQPQTSYVINGANLDLPAVAVEGAVRAGSDVWQQQSGAFRFVYGGASTQTTNTFDSVNLVVFRNASSGSSTGCSGGLLHRGHRGSRVRARARPWAFSIAERYDVPSTSACSVAPRTLDADDIIGARALYPMLLMPPAGLRVVM